MSFDAQVEAIQALADDDRLSAEDLVKEASDPDHACHGEFEWDDTEAAHQFRLHQARTLIGKLRAHITSSTVRVETRMFIRPPSSQQYLSAEEAIANFRDELVQSMFKQMRSTVVKFRRLGDDEIRAQLERALTAD